MNNAEEVRNFLRARRERLTPQQVGLPPYAGRRRVKGLRREEVALLAAVSTDYYTKLERGNLSGVSDSVLEAVASALRLDEAERTHLFNLAIGANSSAQQVARRATSRSGVNAGMQLLLDSINTPAYVRNQRWDILAANRLARALFADAYGDAATFNLVRYLFLDPRSREFYAEWEAVARSSVAAMRIEAGRNPFDQALTDLIGQLCTRSEEFRIWWANQEVKLHRTGEKRFHHTVAGDLELLGQALEFPGEPGLTLLVFTVQPRSASEQALAFLDRWSSAQASSGSEKLRLHPTG